MGGMEDQLIGFIDDELSKPKFQRNSPRLFGLFEQKRENPRKLNARRAMWMTLAVYLGFAGLDFVLIPDVAVLTVSARLALSLLALAVVEALFACDVKARTIDIVCAGFVVAGYLAWLVISIQSSYLLSVSYYMVFGAIFMMVASLLFNFRPAVAVTSSWLILTFFTVGASLVAVVSNSYIIAFAVFYLVCFTLISFVNWKLNAERYSVFLNALKSDIQKAELEEQGKALLLLSNTDSLTGLANRRSIDRELRGYYEAWRADSTAFAVILIDIDLFKRFNDHYGHQEGDRILVAVSAALADMAKRYDATIGRYGGEEFIVLIRADNKFKLKGLAEKMRRSIEALNLSHEDRQDGLLVVTISVGATLSSAEAEKPEKIVSEADRALYAAKASGRNCVRLFDSSDPMVGDVSGNVAALLRIAIPQDLVSLAYQPIQKVCSGKIVAFEALMRLRLLDGTAISPAVFIPVAERTGAIHELGRWAIRTACRELLVPTDLPVVSVNVSAVQLRSPSFPASIASILAETRISPHRLALEITEGLEIEEHSDILRSITELQKLGVQIWLDDFGTGFAGLSWLRLFEFEMIKIDRSFLHESDNSHGEDMLRDIIGLIRNRGRDILIEGVENETQVRLIQTLNVDLMQGFKLGRPATAKWAREKLAGSNAPKLSLISSQP